MPKFWLFQGPVFLKFAIFATFFSHSAKTDVLPLNGTIFFKLCKSFKNFTVYRKNRPNNFFSENENSQISFEKSRQKWKVLPKRQKIVNFSTNVLKLHEKLHRDTTYSGILVPMVLKGFLDFFAIPPRH